LALAIKLLVVYLYKEIRNHRTWFSVRFTLFLVTSAVLSRCCSVLFWKPKGLLLCLAVYLWWNDKVTMSSPLLTHNLRLSKALRLEITVFSQKKALLLGGSQVRQENWVWEKVQKQLRQLPNCCLCENNVSRTKTNPEWRNVA
jgi:hypothetical protein